MSNPKLSIVIHAEEEFNWDDGFYRSNTEVSHGDELIEFVDEILQCGGKVTLAMDYPFIMSSDGKKVVKHFKAQEGENIEFATHLHPWVNPPYEDDNDEVINRHSFPGNLPKNVEFSKLKTLTEEIEKETGTRPITYLAGRYGTGENSAEILKSLGYKVDLSISAYSNFSHVEGPNFVNYTNKIHSKDALTYIPHTCSVVSFNRTIENHFNLNPSSLDFIQRNKISGLLSKVLRVKKYRLSPEGFTYDHMKQMTESLMSIGQKEFLLSFHSPSVKVGGTPYVTTANELDRFKRSVLEYLEWFGTISCSSSFLPSSIVFKDHHEDKILMFGGSGYNRQGM
ncbi:hypothetical protein [Vibrio japonicus]|uniref:WalW protein n=1 Tax=Vibrio japonicus TaxID=1824638 RepID=A0ABY5LPU8_9VIBR|nr:hypothetical protein [Vibrio japonicus]UUM32888.1 hypothetical protein NP165_15110 [Vibrio japonicus]